MRHTSCGEEKKSQNIEQISTGRRRAKADERRRKMQEVVQDVKGSRGIGRRGRGRVVGGGGGGEDGEIVMEKKGGIGSRRDGGEEGISE